MQHNWAVHENALAPFYPITLLAFIRMEPRNVLAKFEMRTFSRS